MPQVSNRHKVLGQQAGLFLQPVGEAHPLMRREERVPRQDVEAPIAMSVDLTLKAQPTEATGDSLNLSQCLCALIRRGGRMRVPPAPCPLARRRPLVYWKEGEESAPASRLVASDSLGSA